MHPSITNMLLGDYSDALADYGLSIDVFCNLDTAKRHAFAASVATARSKQHKNGIREVCNLLALEGDGVPLRSLLHTGVTNIPQNLFARIQDQHLWSSKDYKQVLKLSKCPNAHSILRHSQKITKSDIAVLATLTGPWRKLKIFRMIESIQQVRALVSLGEAMRFVVNEKREEAFAKAVGASGGLYGIEERFWRILYKDQVSPQTPLNTSSNFVRIDSEKQCRALAKAGHCFGDLSMIEAVLASDSLFYSWSGVKNAVVELIRDSGPFGWYVGQACRPKSKALTKLQMRALLGDMGQLESRISSFQWSRKVHNALKVLGR